MFNFNGVFTDKQWEAFRAFTLVQRVDIEKRMTWLKREILKTGIFTAEYEGNFPKKFSVFPLDSYGAKLLDAYRMLGGVPERDMLLRNKEYPAYLQKGTQSSMDGDATKSFGSSFSDGFQIKSENIDDRDTAGVIMRLKSWQSDVIQAKREAIQYRIKKAMDMSDQIINEYELLSKSLKDQIDHDIVIISMYVYDPNNIQIYEGDRFGLEKFEHEDPLT